MAAVPARYAVERGEWKAAAQLAPTRSSYPFVEAITHFARSLGAARSGDVAGGEEGRRAAGRSSQGAASTRRTRTGPTEVDVQRMAAAAWIKLGEGSQDEALQLMRTAADLEDRNEKHIVTPGRSFRRANCWARCCCR